MGKGQSGSVLKYMDYIVVAGVAGYLLWVFIGVYLY
jgi:hypothetical protein